MSIAFISSMNKKIYDNYGKRFLNEFANFASPNLKLYIIFEGDFPEEILHIASNILTIKLMSKEHHRFLKFFGSLQEANGIKIKIFEENGEKKLNVRNDYRFNAIKFSFKPFAIYESLKYIPQDLEYLIWTDADLRCNKKFSHEDLVKFLPHHEILSYLGRKNMYSECGFLGFNLKNSNTRKYIQTVIDIYNSGEIFSLDEWHDSWIWDYVRLEFEKNGLSFLDISGDGHDTEHVYINSGLGEYFDHLKGPIRKKTGQSFSEDYKKK